MTNQPHDAPGLHCQKSPALEELLVAELSESNLRFGRLHFWEPVDAHDPDELFETIDGSITDWVTYHQVQLVFHRTRGALLLRDCDLTDAPPIAIRDRLQRTHHHLVSLQRKLRRRLDERPYWRGRPIVLGVGIAVHGPFSEGLLPRGVPADLLIETSPRPKLEARLEALFDFYSTPATRPISDYGPRLVSALTESPTWIGNVIDELSLRAMYAPATSDPDCAA